MKKVLLVVVMLLLAMPVMAATTITAVKEGDPVKTTTDTGFVYIQTVRIDYSSDVDVRAFALDINATDGVSMKNIRGYKVGESNTTSPGYGIFPSRFRDFVNPTNPSLGFADDVNYNPTPAWNEPGTTNPNTGMGYAKFTAELGTLFLGDANKPALSGTLFRFDVNSEGWGGPNTINITVAANALRGGIVGADAAGIAGVVFNGTSFDIPAGCTTIPTIVGSTTAAADAAIVAAGLTVGTKTSVYSDTVAANIVISQDTGCVAAGTAVNYTYSLGRFPTPAQLIYPTYDPDCNLPIYWSQVAGATGYQLDRSANAGSTWSSVYVGTATFKADSVTAGLYRYRVLAKNADSTSTYLTKTVDCNAILSVCYKNGNTSDANWATWKSAGRPDCWCAAKGANQGPRGTGYQCDGDANQDTEVVGTNAYRVYNADMTRLSQNWKKTAAQLTNDPNVGVSAYRTAAGCADIDHKSQVVGTNAYRVYNADMSILSGNWKKLSSSSITASNKLPGNCPR